MTLVLDAAPARPAAERWRRARATAGRVLSRRGLVAGFLLLWQVASARGWASPSVLPPLDAIAAALWRGLVGGALLDDLGVSLRRAGTAFAAAVTLGLLMG